MLVALAAPLCLAALTPVLGGIWRRVRRLSMTRMAVLGAAALAATAYAGTKVVTERGIRITRCVSDSRKTEIDWISEDSRIGPGASFLVQTSENGVSYATVSVASGTNAVVYGFWPGVTRWWRVAVDMGEVQPKEGE